MLLAVIPITAFVVAVGVSFGMSGSDNSTTSGSLKPDVGALAELTTPTPLPTATVVPTATVIPVRTSCDEIAGTPYRSQIERQWYLDNCTDTAGASTGGGGTGGTGGSIDYSTQGPVNAGGGEFALGDELIIPSIGLDATVYGDKVGGDGTMPNPVGYFYAVWYDFSAFPGLGGYVGNGNTVLAGHVDCARCHNGSAGAAVFWNVRNLSPGASIQYRTSDGVVHNYVVTASQDYTDASNWGGILSSGAADLTLITCNGVFDPSAHEYNLRHVVYAKAV